MTDEPDSTVGLRQVSLAPAAVEVTRAYARVPYRVRFDEAGPDGSLRFSGLLRYAQDVAWIHSESLGFDRRWYADRGLAWVVRSAELELVQPIRAGETVLVRTEVVGFRKVWARRRTEVRGGDGAAGAPLLAWLHTDWVMTDARGQPARVPREIGEVFGVPGTFSPVRVDLPPAPPDASSRRFTVRRHELDPMSHANNAAYLDWADEARSALPLPAQPGTPRRATLEYLVPAAGSQELVATAWLLDPPGDRVRRVAVRITSVGADEVLRATLS